MHKLCVFMIVLVLFLEFCDGQSVRVNCPHIRHNVLSAHRLHRCIRNLRGMMRFMCNIAPRRHRHGKCRNVERIERPIVLARNETHCLFIKSNTLMPMALAAGVQIQRNSLTEEESVELYCQCCSSRCSRRTLLSYCH